MSIDTTAAKPATGSAETARRATYSAHDRNLTVFCQVQSARPIRHRERLDSIPDHQAQRSVGGILFMAGKRLGDGPALWNRNALQCRRQAQPHLRARIVPGQLGESAQHRRTGCFIVTEQPDCPRADVLAGIFQQRFQHGFPEAASRVQRPETHANAG